MAVPDAAAFSGVIPASRIENETVDQKTVLSNNNDSKSEEPTLEALEDAAAIPRGTIDPVYEAKARVLNHAVCLW